MRRDRAGTAADEMYGVGADGAVAAGRERDRQTGGSRRADREVRVTEGLVGERRERDRLLLVEDPALRGVRRACCLRREARAGARHQALPAVLLTRLGIE